MSRGRRRLVQGPGRARLAARLPQRLRDLDRAPGAQHRRLGRHQRPPDPERDDPRSGRRLPGRPALRKRRRRKGTERKASRRHQGSGRADLRRPAPGRRRRRQQGAGKLDRPGTLEERQPDHPRTAAGSPRRKGRDGLDRRRQGQPQPRQPRHQPRRPGRDRRRPGRKAAAGRRPDHDPALRPAEDGAGRRRRGQGPGADPLAAHLPLPSAWRSTSHARAAG